MSELPAPEPNDADGDKLTPEVRLQGARDWAASIQARFAERYAGILARNTNAGPSALPDDYRDQIRRTVTEAGADVSDFEGHLSRSPSDKLGEFDEPTTRELVQQLVDEVVETMNLAGLKPGERKLLISSVPSGLVNAFCCTNTWDDEYHHVFVDAELIVFCSLLAKVVATCFTRGATEDRITFDDSRALKNVKAPDVVRRIENMYAAVIFVGTVRASEPWFPAAEALLLYHRLATAMERFVVAHELSHLMLGHLETAAESVRVADEAFQDVDATIFSHQAEFEADAAGSILATETAARQGQANALISVAPYVFLKGVEVLDACQALHGHPTGGIDSTHPAAGERLATLRAVMAEHMARKDPDGNLPKTIQRVDQLFHCIRKQAITGIVKRTATGLEPRKREGLRVFENDQRPGILGLRVDPGRIRQVGVELAGHEMGGLSATSTLLTAEPS